MSLIALMLAAALQAQPTVQVSPDEPTVVEGLTVEGMRIDEAVEAFVEAVPQPRAGAMLARWDDEFCASVINMEPRYAQALLDRIGEVAASVGVESQGPGCSPNILILLAEDGDAAARMLFEQHRTIFTVGDTRTGSPRALRAWRDSGDAVRWWHMTAIRHMDTNNIISAGATIKVRNVSRISAEVREDMLATIVIIDAAAVGRVRFAALADYIAMALLAQIDPHADTTSFQTVLNLFRDGEEVHGLTEWDRIYLESLYAARRNPVRLFQQENDIRRNMVRQFSVDGD